MLLGLAAYAVGVLVGALFARVLGRDWRCPTHWKTAPGVVALGGGALAFTALPGDLAQIEGPMTVLASGASLWSSGGSCSGPAWSGRRSSSIAC